MFARQLLLPQRVCRHDRPECKQPANTVSISSSTGKLRFAGFCLHRRCIRCDAAIQVGGRASGAEWSPLPPPCAHGSCGRRRSVADPIREAAVAGARLDGGAQSPAWRGFNRGGAEARGAAGIGAAVAGRAGARWPAGRWPMRPLGMADPLISGCGRAVGGANAGVNHASDCGLAAWTCQKRSLQTRLPTSCKPT